VPPLQPTPKDERSLHVVHISAELAPIAKVGGLGDAVAGLASACVARGHHVECLLPFYECIDEVRTCTLARALLARLHESAGVVVGW
jgi:starch synthase